jgi:hypothetical protein
MTDILIRGIPKDVLAIIDEAAATRGMSRNEFLVKRLQEGFPAVAPTVVTTDDLARASRASKDLLDPSVMAQAWQ